MGCLAGGCLVCAGDGVLAAGGGQGCFCPAGGLGGVGVLAGGAAPGVALTLCDGQHGGVLAAVGRDEVGRCLAAMAGCPDAGLCDGRAAQGGLGRGHQEGGGVQHLGGLVQGQIESLGLGRLRQQGDGLADLGGVVDFQGQVQALLALGRGKPFMLGQGLQQGSAAAVEGLGLKQQAGGVPQGGSARVSAFFDAGQGREAGQAFGGAFVLQGPGRVEGVDGGPVLAAAGGQHPVAAQQVGREGEGELLQVGAGVGADGQVLGIGGVAGGQTDAKAPVVEVAGQGMAAWNEGCRGVEGGQVVGLHGLAGVQDGQVHGVGDDGRNVDDGGREARQDAGDAGLQGAGAQRAGTIVGWGGDAGGRGQRGKVRGSFGNGGRGGAGLCVGQRGACVQRAEGSQQGQGQGLAGQGLAAHRV